MSTTKSVKHISAFSASIIEADGASAGSRIPVESSAHSCCGVRDAGSVLEAHWISGVFGDDCKYCADAI